jgi:hypothetical protein
MFYALFIVELTFFCNPALRLCSLGALLSNQRVSGLIVAFEVKRTA